MLTVFCGVWSGRLGGSECGRGERGRFSFMYGFVGHEIWRDVAWVLSILDVIYIYICIYDLYCRGTYIHIDFECLSKSVTLVESYKE